MTPPSIPDFELSVGNDNRVTIMITNYAPGTGAEILLGRMTWTIRAFDGAKVDDSTLSSMEFAVRRELSLLARAGKLIQIGLNWTDRYSDEEIAAWRLGYEG